MSFLVKCTYVRNSNETRQNWLGNFFLKNWYAEISPGDMPLPIALYAEISAEISVYQRTLVERNYLVGHHKLNYKLCGSYS